MLERGGRMEGKKVSIVDVARTAGVSTATVSRVVNQLGGYSKETEKKVLRQLRNVDFVRMSMPLVFGHGAVTVWVSLFRI